MRITPRSGATAPGPAASFTGTVFRHHHPNGQTPPHIFSDIQE
jgi:hypothetical protein